MQRTSQVGKRYARSLLSYAEEQMAVEAVAADMVLISETCAKSKDLQLMLKSPVIPSEKKVAVINKVFGGEIGSISLSFIALLAKRNREELISDIARAFTEIYNEKIGMVSAEITSAIPLNDLERQRAKDLVSSMGKRVELIEKIDSSLIGGFIIRIGDKQLDASVASKLQAFKREITQKH